MKGASMGTMNKKLDSMILDGPGSFDDEEENMKREPPTLEEKERAIEELSKHCNLSKERLREIIERVVREDADEA